MSKRVALNMIDTVTSMAEAAGVSRGILMKELAEQADLFASFIGKGEENLIRAAAAAKKVGMEFGGLVELGDGLLDVTERINKEQTLSTILGQQISLERFAQLNAAGELEAAQQELSNQLKGINNLSAQQTRMFAEQLGVATSDLVRLTGLRSDMPRAGGAFQNEEQKQTGFLSQIVENTKASAKNLKELNG
jgi:predicted HTH domain antitoxin